MNDRFWRKADIAARLIRMVLGAPGPRRACGAIKQDQSLSVLADRQEKRDHGDRFRLQRQREVEAVPPAQTIYEAAILRFRPIMMTMMVALMGTLPTALGSGMGADSRRPLGLCVTGGLCSRSF